MEDVQITCSACKKPFVFRASEQAYYAQRGFQFPKRCKPCRQARRRGGTSRKLVSPSLRRERVPRPTHTVACADCGREVTLVFPPGERTIRCPDCFCAAHAG
ncbi:MAG: zinc-binding protein [Planctomycetota bacterium]|nr:MAG: zinc-binding protein [Planctomycetota bacterium]